MNLECSQHPVSMTMLAAPMIARKIAVAVVPALIVVPSPGAEAAGLAIP
jgi:hypothetical protein